MGFLDKMKESAQKRTAELKDNEDMLKQLAAIPMAERIKMRPEGVKYCIVNNLGKIMDVYDNKVVFTSMKILTTLFLAAYPQNEKTIYYKDATGVQYRLAALLDGYIQIETATGGVTATKEYGGENSIQFSGKETNEEALITVEFIKNRIEELKKTSDSVIMQQSSAEELKKYKELLDIGVITQEEFDAKKKQILNL